MQRRRSIILPLPRGEGRGEGKGTARIFRRITDLAKTEQEKSHHENCNCTRTFSRWNRLNRHSKQRSHRGNHHLQKKEDHHQNEEGRRTVLPAKGSPGQQSPAKHGAQGSDPTFAPNESI